MTAEIRILVIDREEKNPCRLIILCVCVCVGGMFIPH